MESLTRDTKAVTVSAVSAQLNHIAGKFMIKLVISGAFIISVNLFSAEHPARCSAGAAGETVTQTPSEDAVMAAAIDYLKGMHPALASAVLILPETLLNLTPEAIDSVPLRIQKVQESLNAADDATKAAVVAGIDHFKQNFSILAERGRDKSYLLPAASESVNPYRMTMNLLVAKAIDRAKTVYLAVLAQEFSEKVAGIPSLQLARFQAAEEEAYTAQSFKGQCQGTRP